MPPDNCHETLKPTLAGVPSVALRPPTVIAPKLVGQFALTILNIGVIGFWAVIFILEETVQLLKSDTVTV